MPVSVAPAPLNVAPELPIVAAFTVAAIIVPELVIAAVCVAPETVNPVSVPWLVIFGCAAVLNVPPMVVAVTVFAVTCPIHPFDQYCDDEPKLYAMLELGVRLPCTVSF